MYYYTEAIPLSRDILFCSKSDSELLNSSYCSITTSFKQLAEQMLYKIWQLSGWARVYSAFEYNQKIGIWQIAISMWGEDSQHFLCNWHRWIDYHVIYHSSWSTERHFLVVVQLNNRATSTKISYTTMRNAFRCFKIRGEYRISHPIVREILSCFLGEFPALLRQ